MPGSGLRPDTAPAETRPVDAYRAGFARRVARRAWRLSAAVTVTVARSALWALGAPWRRTPAAARAWRVRCYQGWARALCRIGRIEIEVAGAPPRAACVLVTNHVGYADILALAAVLEAPAFVSMHAIRGWPLVGAMAARMGTIFVDRSDKRAIPAVNAAIAAALADGRVVVLFPEGANSDGRAVRPFRPPMLEPAARSGADCAWAVIRYEVLAGDPPPSRSVCWYEEPIGRQALRFLALERVRARIEFGADRVRNADRKSLAAALHARVVARFRPLE
jgi:1-acyl-sn-glycerol-3-phosphate acyltransferase